MFQKKKLNRKKMRKKRPTGGVVPRGVQGVVPQGLQGGGPILFWRKALIGL